MVHMQQTPEGAGAAEDATDMDAPQVELQFDEKTLMRAVKRLVRNKTKMEVAEAAGKKERWVEREEGEREEKREKGKWVGERD